MKLPELSYQRLLASSLVLASVLCPTAVRAELSLCDGTWTNKPCAADSSKQLSEAPANLPSIRDVASAKKELLVHDLTMKSLRARRQYAVDVAIEPAATECQKADVSLESCRARTEEIADRIDKKIAEREGVVAQEKKNKLLEEANDLQRERNQIEQEKVTVIRERRRPIVVRQIDPRHPHHSAGQPSGYAVGTSLSGTSGSISVEESSSSSSTAITIEQR
ncbi:MAG: hypothetical protein KDD44_13190 [Bdellovibrionales bacterium]|nr:hypothetical protein [Bdellovibrionales bacterium]